MFFIFTWRPMTDKWCLSPWHPSFTRPVIISWSFMSSIQLKINDAPDLFLINRFHFGKVPGWTVSVAVVFTMRAPSPVLALCLAALPLSLLLVAGAPPSSQMLPPLYFAICLIVKHDPYLDEWIEYHARMGCSKFYVFDHNSSVPLAHSLGTYVDHGLVEVFRIGDFNEPTSQLYAYQQCVQRHGRKHQFMAFIDSDEYIVVTNSSLRIPDVLRLYEAYGGLVLNWKMFGSSGHVSRPSGGVLANYNRCVDNYHVKTIGNMQYTTGAGRNPHCMQYRKGYFSVDTSKQSNPGPWNPLNKTGPVPSHLYSVMYINHYHTKSQQDWVAKIMRGRKVAGAAAPKYTMEHFFNVQKTTQAAPNCSYLRMPTHHLLFPKRAVNESSARSFTHDVSVSSSVR